MSSLLSEAIERSGKGFRRIAVGLEENLVVVVQLRQAKDVGPIKEKRELPSMLY